MHKLVSIIVTVFNKEKYITRCLRSIDNQTYNKLQVIIVNDGSTDNSILKINNFIKGKANFEVYSQKNRGPAFARNLGLKYVKGEYIVFIDGDDYVSSNFIEELMNYNSYDLVITGYKQLKNKKIIESIVPNNQVISQKNISTYLFDAAHFNYCVLVWNKLFKTKIIKENRIAFKDLKLAEDTIFMFDYFRCIHNVKVVDCTNYFNVVIPDTLSRKMVEEIWSIMLKVEKAGQIDFDYHFNTSWTFLMFKLIKTALGNYCVNYKEFKQLVYEIRKSSLFNKIKYKKIRYNTDKLIYILIKLKLTFILDRIFKYRNK